MMYKDKLVAAIKSSGKILREFKDTVYLPYGCEYSIYLKNLNSVRVVAKIQIDGQDVNDGGFVIYGNSVLDLERFVKDQTKGNRFKFIERTANIEQHRGIKAEDGIIRIEFQFEKPPVLTTTWPPYTYKDNNEWKRGSSGHPPFWGDVYMSNNSGGGGGGQATYTSGSSGTLRGMGVNCASGQSVSDFNLSDCEVPTKSEAGITVPGSISNQQFVTASWFPTEAETHVIVFKLLGETEENRAIRQPVTVKAKPKCQTCGRTNKATSKFCSHCGTSLEVIGQPVTY